MGFIELEEFQQPGETDWADAMQAILRVAAKSGDHRTEPFEIRLRAGEVYEFGKSIAVKDEQNFPPRSIGGWSTNRANVVSAGLRNVLINGQGATVRCTTTDTPQWLALMPASGFENAWFNDTRLEAPQVRNHAIRIEPAVVGKSHVDLLDESKAQFVDVGRMANFNGFSSWAQNAARVVDVRGKRVILDRPNVYRFNGDTDVLTADAIIGQDWLEVADNNFFWWHAVFGDTWGRLEIEVNGVPLQIANTGGAAFFGSTKIRLNTPLIQDFPAGAAVKLAGGPYDYDVMLTESGIRNAFENITNPTTGALVYSLTEDQLEQVSQFTDGFTLKDIIFEGCNKILWGMRAHGLTFDGIEWRGATAVGTQTVDCYHLNQNADVQWLDSIIRDSKFPIQPTPAGSRNILIRGGKSINTAIGSGENPGAFTIQDHHVLMETGGEVYSHYGIRAAEQSDFLIENTIVEFQAGHIYPSVNNYDLPGATKYGIQCDHNAWLGNRATSVLRNCTIISHPATSGKRLDVAVTGVKKIEGLTLIGEFGFFVTNAENVDGLDTSQAVLS